MDRRLFLRSATLLAASAVAADQLELLDRLNWKRRFFPSAAVAPEPLTIEAFLQEHSFQMWGTRTYGPDGRLGDVSHYQTKHRKTGVVSQVTNYRMSFAMGEPLHLVTEEQFLAAGFRV